MAQPYPMPLAPLSLLPNPGPALGWLWQGAGWLLAQVPPPLGFLGYIAGAIWLTRWTARTVRQVPLNPGHPMFRQPGGALPWVGLGFFRLLLILIAAGTGFAIPGALANSVWRDPYVFGADPLGAFGRLAELVGLVCGFLIGAICQYQLNALLVAGTIGYGLLRLTHWTFGG